MTMPPEADLRRGTGFEGERFQSQDWSGLELEGQVFRACHFQSCRFADARLSGCAFEDCTFEDCDFTSARFDTKALKNVRFLRGKLLGSTWRVTSVLGTTLHFVDCDLSYAFFTHLPTGDYTFEDCRALEIQFEHSDLRCAAFPGTRLDGSAFRQNDLRGTDFSKASGVDLDATSNRLGDTRLSLEAGRDFLGQLGIRLPALEPPDEH